MVNKNFIKVSGVYIPEGTRPDPYFEKLYLAVRKKEHRLYINNDLLTLPDINDTHIHHDEWLVRRASSQKLIHYIKKKNKPLQILEIGCGNGWLSHKLAEIPQTKVIGLDINYTELEQGASVFLENNLQFVYGDIRKNVLQNLQFDMIVFAASVSYFSSLHEILKIALQHLRVEGEIHVIDSLFYGKENILAAKQRCKTYYRELGFPEMADFYFHHLLDDFKGFNYLMMPEQDPLLKKIFFKKNPFPWIRIQHSRAL
jgi:ubiquinone/menaquinone biosynthesis C-methylase UbiE